MLIAYCVDPGPCNKKVSKENEYEKDCVSTDTGNDPIGC